MKRIGILLNMTKKQITDMLYNGLSYEWIEDNEYTVLGVNDSLDEIHIYWSEELVEQMVEGG